jgi:hypothetical protein
MVAIVVTVCMEIHCEKWCFHSWIRFRVLKGVIGISGNQWIGKIGDSRGLFQLVSATYRLVLVPLTLLWTGYWLRVFIWRQIQ